LRKEWDKKTRVTNKDKIKQYRDDHRQERNERNKHKCVCEKCGLEYTTRTKKRHEESKRHINYITININNNNITGNDATINITQQKTELEEELNQF